MPDSKLDPSAVRKLAKTVPGCRESGSLEDDSVLSFLVGLDQQTNTSALARINVYTTTGTIGTCRVLQGQVREIFKRNVSSLNVLKKSLTHPPNLTSVDGSKDALPDKMELAEVAMCILLADRDRLKSHLEAATEAAREKEQDVSGMDFEFGLPKKVMKQVEQCLQDILNMGKFVTCVTTNGKSAVFLYGHGGVAFTPGIPKALHHKLKQLNRSNETRPSYVAIGTRDRYYVAFHDGTADWKAPKALDKILKRRSTPRSVAFGDKYDSFFVVFDDGSWECHDIHDELADKLEDRADRPDLVCVTLGPNGEWFLRAKNGRMWWGGISEELDEMVQNLLESDRYLNFLDFGEDGTYFLSYD
jgi:hypothetical protein